MRIERDSMGEVPVPDGAYYGASTQRAVDNFPISDLRFDRTFIWAMGVLKVGFLSCLSVQPLCLAASVKNGKVGVSFCPVSHFVKTLNRASRTDHRPCHGRT